MEIIGVETKQYLPKMYYCSKTHSDREWIKSRMHHIPEERKHEVSKEYEKRYLTSKNSSLARKNANTWLDGISREYRSASQGN